MLHRYMAVKGRQVRYHVGGSGPPVLLVFANSAVLDALTIFLSETFTVFSFDNPGYGGSDPLAIADLTMADMADALAEAMRAMSFGRVPVFGTHMGAAIALELGVRHPDLVAGLVLDGLPIFLPEEVARYERLGYFEEIVPDVLGGQFARAWTRVRDWLSFDPWCDRSRAALRTSGPSTTPEELHGEALGYFRAAATFARPYRAAFGFGAIAAARVSQLAVPAVFTALSDDGLALHLDRLPVLGDGQEIVRLGDDIAALHCLAADRLAACQPDSPAPRPQPLQAAAGDRPNAQFIGLAHGQLFYRELGQPTAPPLLVLPDAPGSSLQSIDVLKPLARSYHVYCIDLPGTGQSERLPERRRAISDFVDVVAEFCEAVGGANLTVHGLGFGSSVAVEFAARRPDLVQRCVVEGLFLPNEDERAALGALYAPPIDIDRLGSYWYATWLMLRDSRIYWPWFARGEDAIRDASIDLDAGKLHAWTLDVIGRHESYADVVNAVFAHDVKDALARCAVPLRLVESDHPFCRYYRKLPRSI